MAANQDPFNNYRFIVQIDGINAGFSEVIGLETESKQSSIAKVAITSCVN
jgi:hypothetical protein